jgi:hypothetical protein
MAEPTDGLRTVTEPASDAVAASFAGSAGSCALIPSLLRLSEA